MADPKLPPGFELVSELPPGFEIMEEGGTPAYGDDWGQYAKDVARAGIGQGLGLNYGDEAIAGIRSLAGTDYDTAIKEEREALKRIREHHPIAGYGAEIAGSLAMPGGAALSGMLRAPTLAGRIGRGASVGAGIGAAAGAGAAEGGLGERLAGAGSGAMFGAGIGAGLPVAGQVLSPVGRSAYNFMSPTLARWAATREALADKYIRSNPRLQAGEFGGQGGVGAENVGTAAPQRLTPADAAAEESLSNIAVQKGLTIDQIEQRIRDYDRARTAGEGSVSPSAISLMEVDPVFASAASSAARASTEGRGRLQDFISGRQTGATPIGRTANEMQEMGLTTRNLFDPTASSASAGQQERFGEQLARTLRIYDTKYHGFGKNARQTDDELAELARKEADQLYSGPTGVYERGKGYDLRPHIQPAIDKFLAENANEPEAIQKMLARAVKAIQVGPGVSTKPLSAKAAQEVAELRGVLGKLEPGEADSILEMHKFVRDAARQKGPASLHDWIVQNGGLRNQGGELKHYLGREHGRPGLVNNSGMTLDHAALKAWEQGYVPTTQRPSINEFLEALASNRVRGIADENLAETLRVAEEMSHDLGRFGITAKTDGRVLREALGFTELPTKQGKGVLDVERLDKSKRQLDDVIDQKFNRAGSKFSKLEGRKLAELRDVILEAVDGVKHRGIGEAYGNARAVYSSRMQAREHLQAGRDAWKGDPDSMAKLFQRIGNQEGDPISKLYRHGVHQGYLDMVNQPGFKRGADVSGRFDTSQMQALIRAATPRTATPTGRKKIVRGEVAEYADRPERFGDFVAFERAMTNTRNEVLGNSKTAQRLKDDDNFDAVTGLGEAINSLRGGGTHLAIEAFKALANKVFGYRQDTAAAVAKKLATANRDDMEAFLIRLRMRMGKDRFNQMSQLMQLYSAQMQRGGMVAGTAGASE